MKTILSLIGFLALLGSACNPVNNDPYVAKIMQERAEKDSAFSIAGETPIPENALESFEGLNYFPVDKEFIVNAKFELNPNPVPFEMATTTDRKPVYTHYGTAHFSLDGKELQLNVYQNQELVKNPEYADHLFIPFRDLSCPDECYGGGRYLDVSIPEGDMLTIDFNRAYNPYCAYNHDYSCPIPPEENTLDIAIEAGEKKFE